MSRVLRLALAAMSLALLAGCAAVVDRPVRPSLFDMGPLPPLSPPIDRPVHHPGAAGQQRHRHRRERQAQDPAHCAPPGAVKPCSPGPGEQGFTPPGETP